MNRVTRPSQPTEPSSAPESAVRVTTSNASHGMTLIELMVVVAIVGILAAIGGAAYMNQLKQGKITSLKQRAMEVSQLQQDYRARNGRYITLKDNPYYPSGNQDAKDNWEQSLGFRHESLANLSVEIRTQGGVGGSCDICPSGAEPDTTDDNGNDTSWYAVTAKQDLDPSSSEMTTVVMHSDIESPIVLNEGE